MKKELMYVAPEAKILVARVEAGFYASGFPEFGEDE